MKTVIQDYGIGKTCNIFYTFSSMHMTTDGSFSDFSSQWVQTPAHYVTSEFCFGLLFVECPLINLNFILWFLGTLVASRQNVFVNTMWHKNRQWSGSILKVGQQLNQRKCVDNHVLRGMQPHSRIRKGVTEREWNWKESSTSTVLWAETYLQLQQRIMCFLLTRVEHCNACDSLYPMLHSNQILHGKVNQKSFLWCKETTKRSNKRLKDISD